MAIWVTGDDDNGQFGVDGFGLLIDVVASGVGELEIEETEVKFLFIESDEGVFATADQDPTEARLFEEKIEHCLDAFVIVDDEGGGASHFGAVKDFAIEQVAFDSPAAADFDGGQLATLHEIVDRWDGNTEILSGFLDGHEVVSGRRR